MGNNNGDGMMGGGNNNGNGQGSFDDGEEDGDMDALAMMGVLAAIKETAGGAWDAYNGALADKPILVKVRRSLVAVFSVQSMCFWIDVLCEVTYKMEKVPRTWKTKSR